MHTGTQWDTRGRREGRTYRVARSAAVLGAQACGGAVAARRAVSPHALDAVGARWTLDLVGVRLV